MKKVNSKLLLALGVVSFSLALVGCSNSHHESDVKKYVNEMGIGECEISYGGQNEYKENIWKVTQKSTGIEFEILDDVSVGGMLPGKRSYTLRDDYLPHMLDYYADEIATYEGFEVYEGSGSIVVKYSSLSELNTRCEDLSNVFDFLYEKYTGLHACNAYLLYSSDFTDKFAFDPTDTGTMASRLMLTTQVYCEDMKKDPDAVLKNAKDKYLYLGLLHGLDEVTGEFTDEEIDAFVESSDIHFMNRVITYTQGTPEDPDNATTKISSRVVTEGSRFFYGSLYKYLVEMGYEVSGTPAHFTYKHSDGRTYEFSYDFYDEKKDETYYLVDGNKEYGSNRFHIDCYDMDDLFGIVVECKAGSDIE